MRCGCECVYLQVLLDGYLIDCMLLALLPEFSRGGKHVVIGDVGGFVVVRRVRVAFCGSLFWTASKMVWAGVGLRVEWSGVESRVAP